MNKTFFFYNNNIFVILFSLKKEKMHVILKKPKQSRLPHSQTSSLRSRHCSSFLVCPSRIVLFTYVHVYMCVPLSVVGTTEHTRHCACYLCLTPDLRLVHLGTYNLFHYFFKELNGSPLYESAVIYLNHFPIERRFHRF